MYVWSCIYNAHWVLPRKCLWGRGIVGDVYTLYTKSYQTIPESVALIPPGGGGGGGETKGGSLGANCKKGGTILLPKAIYTVLQITI